MVSGAFSFARGCTYGLLPLNSLTSTCSQHDGSPALCSHLDKRAKKRNSCSVQCFYFVSFVCFLFLREGVGGVRWGERGKVSPSHFYSILSNDITKVQLMARRALNASKWVEKQENMQEMNISKETTIKVGRINQPEDVYFENPWEFMFLLLVYNKFHRTFSFSIFDQGFRYATSSSG